MTLRYLLVLVLLGLVAVGLHYALTSLINLKEKEYSAIQLSANQNAIAHQIVRDAWRLVGSYEAEQNLDWCAHLLAGVETLESKHNALLQRSPEPGMLSANSPEAANLLYSAPNLLNPKVLHFVAEAKELTHSTPESLTFANPHLSALDKALMPLLEAQDNLTRQYEEESRKISANAQNFSFLMLLILLCLLLFMGIFVFRPMANRVQTEINLLTESELLIRSIMESSFNATIMCDTAGVVKEWNPQAEFLFGWSKEEIIGKTIPEGILPSALLTKNNLDLRKPFFARRDALLNKPLEFVALRRNGDRLIVEISISAVKQGEALYFTAFIRDISQQKFIQAELKKYRKHLEELLVLRGKQLESNYRKLKASERLATVGELAANVAHEIKNPLASIRGGIRILSKDIKADDQNAELRNDLLKEVKRLDETVNELLTLARPLVIKKSTVEINVFLKEMEESWRLSREISKHQICIAVEGDLIFPIDLRLMSQVLTNLVMNSSHAMTTSGLIKVTARRVADNLLLSVSDTGPGIPESSLPMIFTPFYTTKTRGTGLGLSICKKNVEALEGTIAVESILGRGTSFFISLPYEIQEEQSILEGPVLS